MRADMPGDIGEGADSRAAADEVGTPDAFCADQGRDNGAVAGQQDEAFGNA